MTYRSIPRRWLLAAQLATLLGTVLIGCSLLLAPERSGVIKLSLIERDMDAEFWAWLLIIAAAAGFFFEAATIVFHKEFLLAVVAIAHVVCCGVLTALSVSALAGVLERQPWDFGTPTMGFLMVVWHVLFVKHRQQPEIPLEPLEG